MRPGSAGLSLLAFGVLGLSAALPPDAAPGAATDTDPWWLTSYPEALAQARATGKPILLEFR